MKACDFNKIYEKACQLDDIINNDAINYTGWFWINLTNKQLTKMYNLLVSRGAEEKVDKEGKTYINLPNGCYIFK
jgi:CRISPR/Cas system CSM-associated protein Csm2 small subunit